MTSSYERLRTAVYKVLYPDGVALEFGCEVLLSDGVRVPVLSDSNVVRVVRKGGISTQEGRKWWMENGYDYGEGFFYILGKPLTIADVLRVLGGLYAIAGDGALLHVKGGKYEHVRGEVGYVHFVPSKPLSDPANDAACAAVLELIDPKSL